MTSNNAPCSVSIIARQDESVFSLSSLVEERKDFQSKGEGSACLA